MVCTYLGIEQRNTLGKSQYILVARYRTDAHLKASFRSTAIKDLLVFSQHDAGTERQLEAPGHTLQHDILLIDAAALERLDGTGNECVNDLNVKYILRSVN